VVVASVVVASVVVASVVVASVVVALQLSSSSPPLQSVSLSHSHDLGIYQLLLHRQVSSSQRGPVYLYLRHLHLLYLMQ